MPREAKRSLTIAGHRTSISLEPVFWDLLKEIAAGEHRSLASLVGEIDNARVPGEGSLSSAIRVYIVGRLRGRSP
jgi:predicted DNA-binding ribbon-helix-helix protein